MQKIIIALSTFYSIINVSISVTVTGDNSSTCGNLPLISYKSLIIEGTMCHHLLILHGSQFPYGYHICVPT